MRTRVRLAVALLVAGVVTGVPLAGADSTPVDSTGSLGAPSHDANLSVRVLGAPRAVSDRLDSAANVTALRRSGLVTNVTAVPMNGTLVVELGLPGLADEYAADESNRSNARMRVIRR